jgi:hypothetical protein
MATVRLAAATDLIVRISPPITAEVARYQRCVIGLTGGSEQKKMIKLRWRRTLASGYFPSARFVDCGSTVQAVDGRRECRQH